MKENPENMPFAMQGFPNLIREGGKTACDETSCG